MDAIEGWSDEEAEWEVETAEVIRPEEAPIVSTPEEAQNSWDEAHIKKAPVVLTPEEAQRSWDEAHPEDVQQRQLKEKLAKEKALKAKLDRAAKAKNWNAPAILTPEEAQRRWDEAHAKVAPVVSAPEEAQSSWDEAHPKKAPVVLTPEEAQRSWDEAHPEDALQRQLEEKLAKEKAFKAKLDRAAKAQNLKNPAILTPEEAQRRWDEAHPEFALKRQLKEKLAKEKILKAKLDRAAEDAEAAEAAGLKAREAAEQKAQEELEGFVGAMDAWIEGEHQRRREHTKNVTKATVDALSEGLDEHVWKGSTLDERLRMLRGETDAWLKGEHAERLLRDRHLKHLLEEVTEAAAADVKAGLKTRLREKHLEEQRQAEEQRLREQISKAHKAVEEALASGLEEQRLQARIKEQQRLRQNLERAYAAAVETLTTGLDDSLETDEDFYRHGLEESVQALPAAVDWRNASDGKDYLEPPMEQGSCGSCWAVAGVRMLTARHRIAQRDPKIPAWSVAFPLYCSEFNQGCEGGYGYLGMKWSEEIGLLPSYCAEYKDDRDRCEVDDACVSNLTHSRAQRWRANASRYVGGAQRQATQAALMKELVEGPVVVSLDNNQIGNDFMFYAGGVYFGEQSSPEDDSTGGHAVLLAGYGEEDGMKYWLVQNSWGAEWGEGGYVRLSRDAISLHTAAVADSVEDEQYGRQVERALAQARKQPLPPPP